MMDQLPGQLVRDEEFRAAQERVRRAKVELRSAEDALWELLGSNHPMVIQEKAKQ